MPVKKRNVEVEVRFSWEPKKKYGFSGKHISFSFPSYRTRHEEISLKVVFLYIRLPWFLVHKIIKLRIGSPPPRGSFFWHQKKQNRRLARFLLKSVARRIQCIPKSRPCRLKSETKGLRWGLVGSRKRNTAFRGRESNSAFRRTERGRRRYPWNRVTT